MDSRGYVTATETRQALQALYREDPETNLSKVLGRVFTDDLKPFDDKGRWRPNFLLILVGVLIVAWVSVFFYFSFGALG